ncbi:MAG: RNA-dependent RNA-polymerase [Armatimonadetes bacterium]|nr:RNA-dependent RNA-polymerase [Armatimonadota bacterium]
MRLGAMLTERGFTTAARAVMERAWERYARTHEALGQAPPKSREDFLSLYSGRKRQGGPLGSVAPSSAASEGGPGVEPPT